ncbi:Aspartyl protease family protein [Vitis vinifera]|uniref:Aspartyl protease family protein n=1 Tax=Vitis vinifera TaxID=29760 RepID=A0A438GF92_VITVI|nr:Aspartyl protease family protein [Vitis vinifera]
MNYEDNSYSKGVFVCDEVTLKPDVFPKFQFGCGDSGGGDFGSASGKAISASPSLKFTRLLNPSSGSVYFVELIGISVAKKRLNVSSSLFASPGTIIDSGTVITHLPTAAYEALRTAFQQEMLHCPSVSPPPQEKPLDTCYNLKGCGGRNIKLPEIVLHFVGEVDVSLHPSGILWPMGT